MSYILDALRKADAQRERDPARGIHAQPGRVSMGDGPRNAGLRAGLWAAGAVGIVALSAAGWYLYRDPVAAPAAKVQVAVAPAVPPRVSAPPPAAPAVAPPVAPAPVVLPPPVVVSPPAAAAPPAAMPGGGAPHRVERSAGSTPPMPGVPGVGSTARALAAQAAQAAAAQQPSATPSVPAPSAASAMNASTPPEMVLPPGMTPPSQATGTSPGMAPPSPYVPPVALPAASPPPPVAGLPPDAPKLVITGGVYTASKAQRMLIVNGQVMAEGADLGSGVTLEEIRPRSAVLRFRGGRYAVSY